MSDANYKISIENVHQTIEIIHKQLLKQNIKVKKSAIKEVISYLFGFKNSNILDVKIKINKEELEAACSFGKNGTHKEIMGLILNTSKNPLKIYDFLNKYTSYTSIISFSDDFKVSGGFKYEKGYTLFAEDKFLALKTVLNWDAITQLKFIYLKDVPEEAEAAEFKDESCGYWELTFVGDGDERNLGTDGSSQIDSYGLNDDEINTPNAPIENVSRYFLGTMLELSAELAYFVQDSGDYMSYLDYWIEEFYFKTYSVNNEEQFTAHIKKFLPYLPIEDIVMMEIGSASISYLDILKNFGAKFSHPELHCQALLTGNLAASNYLTKKGNSLENLFTISYSGFFEPASFVKSDDKLEMIKLFYSSSMKLGVSVNRRNEEGCSPLHNAAIHGNDDLYSYLVFLGADEYIKNNKGNTPRKLLDELKTKREKQKGISRIYSEQFEDFLFEK